MASNDTPPTDTSTIVENVSKILTEEDDPVDPGYVSPEQVGTLISAVSDAFTIVLKGLVKALSVIFAQGGILLVLILAGIGFMFVYWAIRLIHLRGR